MPIKCFAHNLLMLLNRLRGTLPKETLFITYINKLALIFENRSILRGSGTLRKVEKLCSSALPNIECNCSIVFLRQMYWLFIYASKYIFSQTTIAKSQSELTEMIQNSQKLMLFRPCGVTNKVLCVQPSLESVKLKTMTCFLVHFIAN